jgi:hypothetical protein
MPRQTHRSEEERKESIQKIINLSISPQMRHFLDLEARRLTDKRRQIRIGAKRVKVQDIIRALVTSYYEKRTIGLLVNPDD